MKKAEEISGSPEKRPFEYLPKTNHSPLKTENNDATAVDETIMPT